MKRNSFFKTIACAALAVQCKLNLPNDNDISILHNKIRIGKLTSLTINGREILIDKFQEIDPTDIGYNLVIDQEYSHLFSKKHNTLSIKYIAPPILLDGNINFQVEGATSGRFKT